LEIEIGGEEEERWEKYWQVAHCAARERRKKAAKQRQRDEDEKEKAAKEGTERKKEEVRLEALEMCQAAARVRLASLRSSVSIHRN